MMSVNSMKFGCAFYNAEERLEAATPCVRILGSYAVAARHEDVNRSPWYENNMSWTSGVGEYLLKR